jgi:glycosyl transferase family 25
MHSFYINLDRRVDRRIQFETECARMGIAVERFSAIAHSVPALGCAVSHVEVLKLARDRGYDRVCIFEDDFEFLVSREEYAAVVDAIPADADVVMLGWYLYETQPYNDTFGRVLDATTASGYIVSRNFYDRLIARLEEGATLFKANLHTHDAVSKYINDQYWRRIQPSALWLHTRKRVGRQRPSYSDLVGSQVAYDY